MRCTDHDKDVCDKGTFRCACGINVIRYCVLRSNLHELVYYCSSSPFLSSSGIDTGPAVFGVVHVSYP